MKGNELKSNLSQRLLQFKRNYEKIADDPINYRNMGLYLLNNCIVGSPYETVTPPVLTGLLRNSGKVEVEGKTVWIGFDTPYAARQHENLTPAGAFQLGLRSQQAGNVGGKFLEKHLYNVDEIQEMFDIFGKEVQRGVFQA